MVEEWSLEATPTVPMVQFAISATIRVIDAFWITQSPMIVDLRFGRFDWQWYNVLPTIDEKTASARVYGKPDIIKDGVGDG